MPKMEFRCSFAASRMRGNWRPVPGAMTVEEMKALDWGKSGRVKGSEKG